MRWPCPKHHDIRRNFIAWIKRLLRHKATSSTIGEIEHINDLLENGTMLAERIAVTRSSGEKGKSTNASTRTVPGYLWL
jgi:hypothetical protein